MNELINLLEAILFASGSPMKRTDIFLNMPEHISKAQFNDAIKALEQKYSGNSGIILETFNDKLQFASNSKYGNIVANILQPIKEKELTKILMEVLAIVAYRQPITRSEIEDVRGVSADYALSVLSRVNLIKTCGFKQAPGRPMLYITTEDFLKKFNLHSIDELPDYSEIMKRLVEFGNFNEQRDELYRDIVLQDNFQDDKTSVAQQQLDELNAFISKDEEFPEFLKDEEISTFESHQNYELQQLVASDILSEEIFKEKAYSKSDLSHEHTLEKVK